jgi:hypothetical protein
MHHNCNKVYTLDRWIHLFFYFSFSESSVSANSYCFRQFIITKVVYFMSILHHFVITLPRSLKYSPRNEEIHWFNSTNLRISDPRIWVDHNLLFNNVPMIDIVKKYRLLKYVTPRCEHPGSSTFKMRWKRYNYKARTRATARSLRISISYWDQTLK